MVVVLLDSNFAMISLTIRPSPSISSSGVIPAKLILQPTYTGRRILRARIFDNLVA